MKQETAILCGNVGYPRIGDDREWKKLLERFWAGKISRETFDAGMKDLRLSRLLRQRDAGLDCIPVGDMSLYDHVLDTAAMFGIVPARFGWNREGTVSLELYFAMARGNDDASACEMTKWFNTNYHYIVPEIEHEEFRLTENKPLLAWREAKTELGIDGRPIVVGPFTLLKLSKGYPASQFAELLDRLVSAYAQLMQELEQAGVSWVQVDEPMLAFDLTDEEMALAAAAYSRLHEAAPSLNVLLQTYHTSVRRYSDVVALPVQGIGLDFVHDGGRNAEAVRRHGFPAGKTLAAGLIDGRSVWRADLPAQRDLAERLLADARPERLLVQPSCSLLHVPVSAAREAQLPALVREALAFADEKLGELRLLARMLGGGAADTGAAAGAPSFESGRLAMETLRQAYPMRVRETELPPDRRATPFAERYTTQQAKWRLPLLPTTTIGSFPQTEEVRRARRQWRNGELDGEAYERFIRSHIAEWVGIQENLGLDVLVHGEFERTDMVEFFGEKLDGFAFSEYGWVQSYGSRCVKPPIIYGDVRFIKPMTVDETAYAQSLTGRPVKGMLTGPVTILQWSFVRSDVPRRDVALQLALALRHEVQALEKAGIGLIQVDEPALREGLPLEPENRAEYLEWAVRAFRLATSGVGTHTQIHTHMCYCEFNDIIDAILDMDADVISIETSRSHGELIEAFEQTVYDKGIGLGVYDIHSPRVPDVEEMVRMIERALRVLPARLFWINPDCGLKTRGVRETTASLGHMTEAARIVRSRLLAEEKQDAQPTLPQS